MSTRRKKPSDYAVGYRKPPTETQFKKGMSGNPKGRPKGAKNISTIIQDTLFEPIQIQQNGKTKTVPALKAIMLKMRNNALAGDYRSGAHAIQLASRPTDPEEAGRASAEANPLDQQTIVEMMRDYLDHKAAPSGDGSDEFGGAPHSNAENGRDEE